MAERPAVNASPLIHLSRGGLISLLQVAGSDIVIPLAVAEEIQRRGALDITVQVVERTPWLHVVETPVQAEIIRAWDLGNGESSVLAWAYAHSGTEAIIDDLSARRCAAPLGIPVRGTLGLVLTAKRRGMIAKARPLLEDLRRAGMYLSDRVMDWALKEVGE